MSDYFSNPLAMNFNTGFTNSNPSMVNFGGNAATGAPAWSANQINSSMGFGPNGVGAQNQALLNNLYGPQGFGGATAQAAATGAAYGRATGGFGGGAKPSVFDTGAAPVPYLSGGGMPFGGGGFGGRGASIPSMPAQAPFQDYGGGANPGGFSPSPNYFGDSPSNRDAIAGRMADAFRQFGQTPAQAQNQSAIDAVQQFSGRGTGVAPDQPYFAPPSEGARGAFGTRFDAAPQDGAGSPGSFADRFAPMMRGNPGTPSQYYTGSQYPGAQTPPAGYQTLFGADNPGGALPVGGFRGIGPGIMNESPQEGAGSFDPSAFSPKQYAPASPFGSGGGVGGRGGGSGGLGTGTGTQMPPTQLPFFGGGGSGFGAPGSTQSGGMYAGSGRYPALVGAPNDAYGNPFIQGNAPPYAAGAGRMGGGIGYGGLDALGQGTGFRGVR